MQLPMFGWDKVAIIIPTLNAGRHLREQIRALSEQGVPSRCFLIIDSSSDDHTREEYASFGAQVVLIDRSEFNHGGTRRYATLLRSEAEFIVMMTQDAIPAAADSLRRLLQAFEDPRVGLAYGRQLPRQSASAIECHGRLMNYPDESDIRSSADRVRLGVKTTFCSNSFAAYRRTALEEVGNFPHEAFFGEDQIVAGRMLLSGWTLAYCSDATVFHSHDYSIGQDFRRYFDVGVFHARNRWLLQEFGKAEGEGLRFVWSEMKYLLKQDPRALPSAWVRTVAKYGGYKLGKIERRLSSAMKKKLSMQPFYWRQRSIVERTLG